MAPEWRLLVEQVKRLAVPSGREALGAFALEGHRSMERALRNEAPISEVLISQRFFDSESQREKEIVEGVVERGIPLRVAPDAAVAELTGGRRIGDVFAVMTLPAPPTWEALFTGEGRRMILVGWNLADPGNTGALIRTALAIGASGFLAVGTTDPWHPKSVRTSMGSLFKLPILRVPEDERWMEALQDRGVETFATDCRGGESLPEVKPTQDHLALVMGSEAFGLSPECTAACDRRITIPMPGGVDSFSVNAAAAVLAYGLLQA